MGGTGKTSLCLKINEMLNKAGIRSCFIKKYYKDQLDEQKLLDNFGKTFVVHQLNLKIIQKNLFLYATQSQFYLFYTLSSSL